MRFLSKPRAELEPHLGLRYGNSREAGRAREILTELQHFLCAYTECHLSPLQSVDVEHFDPRLKHTEEDNILNWHAVVHRVNNRKPRKIEAFLPMANPLDAGLSSRWKFEGNEFQPVSADDLEVTNLIRWIGANLPEVYEERAAHVARLRDVRNMLGEEAFLLQYLREHPDQLQFASAIEAELGIPAAEMLRANPPLPGQAPSA